MTLAEDMTPECRMRQEMYAYIYDHPMVQQLLDGYNRTKKTTGFMGRALQDVENRVTDVAIRTMPIYEHYVQPSVDAVHSAVNRSVENTKRVVDITKSTAVTTTTISIGAAVVISQLIISLGLTGTNWLIDSVIFVKQAGGSAVGRIRETEKLLEDRFRNYVGCAQNMAQVPISKLTDQANIFLDIANSIMDRIFGLESEADPIESSIGTRLFRMVSRFSQVLQDRAHDNIIDPMANQMHSAMEQLNSYMNLVGYVHRRREWVFQRIEGMHASVNELKTNVERQASELMSQPELVLMQSVRNTSQNIIGNVNSLKERGMQLLGENVVSKLDSVVAYLEQLDNTFEETDNLYELRDEVLAEAHAKMTDFLNWTSALLVRKNSSESAEMPKNTCYSLCSSLSRDEVNSIEDTQVFSDDKVSDPTINDDRNNEIETGTIHSEESEEFLSP